MMHEMSPNIRDEMTTLWNMFQSKTLTPAAFLERAKVLLGPEKFAILATMETVESTTPGTRKRTVAGGTSGGATGAKKQRLGTALPLESASPAAVGASNVDLPTANASGSTVSIPSTPTSANVLKFAPGTQSSQDPPLHGTYITCMCVDGLTRPPQWESFLIEF
jgi:hypothetical protein